MRETTACWGVALVRIVEIGRSKPCIMHDEKIKQNDHVITAKRCLGAALARIVEIMRSRPCTLTHNRDKLNELNDTSVF